MRQALQALVKQLAALQQQIGELERNIHAQHRANDRADGSRPSRVSA